MNVAAHRRHLSAIRFHDALLLDHEPLVPLAHSPQLASRSRLADSWVLLRSFDPMGVLGAHGRSGGDGAFSVERTPLRPKGEGWHLGPPLPHHSGSAGSRRIFFMDRGTRDGRRALSR